MFFGYWGRSHEGRLRVHAESWLYASKQGFSLCDNLHHFEKFMNEESGRKAASLWQPHYHRQPIETMLHVNGLSKIGIALAGAGRKTFRATEVTTNAAMLMWNDDIAWAYDWRHGKNCIKCSEGDEMATLFSFLEAPLLYDIYVNGVENCRNYQVDTYVKNHIQKKINDFC